MTAKKLSNDCKETEQLSNDCKETEKLSNDCKETEELTALKPQEYQHNPNG